MYIKTDPWDEHEWARARLESQTLQEMFKRLAGPDVNGNPTPFDTYAHLLADTFQLMRQPLPEWVDTGSVPELGETLLREIESTEEFQNLRAQTVGDTTASAFAAEMFGRDMYDKLTQSGALGLIDARVKDPDLEPLDEETEHKLMADVRMLTRPMFDDAIEQVQQMQETEELLNNNDPFDREKPMPMRFKLELHDRIKRSQTLQQKIQMAGRFRRITTKKRASVVKELRQEYVGVTMGRDPAKAIPSELALLTNPATKNLFFKKVAEGQLLQYEQHGNEQLGAGPIVMCLDGSASMRGMREVWAKAVTMAYMSVAQTEKRDMRIIEFGGSTARKRWEFLYGSAPNTVERTQVVAMLDHFLSDGYTDIESVVAEAGNCILNDAKAGGKWKSADVVVVTDGDSTISDVFVEAWAKAQALGNFETFGIVIGSDAGGMRTLSKFIPEQHLLNVTKLDESGSDAALNLLFSR